MKVFRAISVLLLAVLMLVSSTSFMIGMHICMGEVQNIALFTTAEGCEKEKDLPPCHRHQTAPCCEDESIVHEADELKAHVVKINLEGPSAVDIAQPLVLIAEIIPAAPLSGIQYYSYDPPLRSWDLTVVHRSFLI